MSQPAWRQRLQRNLDLDPLLDTLCDQLSARDLQSLLLEVYARRTRDQSPSRLLQRYRENRFVRPSPLDPRLSQRVLGRAWDLLPDPFLPLELAPLAPLGTCSSLAPVHQNKVVSALRHCEASADPAPLLALECALRRSHGPVHLATWQRITRAQALPPGPYYAHFAVLVLASADRGGTDFEVNALFQHLDYYRRLLADLAPRSSCQVLLSDWSGGPIAEALYARGLEFTLDPQRTSGRGYYRRACFKIHLDGLEVGDGGFTDWTARLLSQTGEAFLSSGLGWERLLQQVEKSKFEP